MTIREKNIRPSPISYRPPMDVREKIMRDSEKMGLSVSAYLTYCIEGKVSPRQIRRPPVEKKLLAKLLAVMAEIRDELKKIAISHEDSDFVQAHLSEALETLTECRAAFFKAMGRKP